MTRIDCSNRIANNNKKRYSIQVYEENEGSIFSTSSSATIFPEKPICPKKKHSHERHVRVEDYSDEESEDATMSSLQSNTFHVLRFFFCILQMLLILATIMVTVVGIRYSMIYTDISKCPKLEKDDDEPGNVDDDKDDYNFKRVSHNHSHEYLFNLKVCITILFIVVGLGTLQQFFGWFALMRLTKKMMILCLLTDVVIIIIIFIFNFFRIDSSKMIVTAILLLTIIDSVLLVLMFVFVKTPDKPLILQMQSNCRKRKMFQRRKSWIMNSWSWFEKHY